MYEARKRIWLSASLINACEDSGYAYAFFRALAQGRGERLNYNRETWMVSRDIRHPALSFARVFSTKEEYIGTFKCPPATFSLFLSHFFALQRYPPNFNPPRRWQRVWKVARWLRKWVIKVVEEAAVEEKDMIERRGDYARGRGRDQELEIGVHTYNDDKSYMTRSCFFSNSFAILRSPLLSKQIYIFRKNRRISLNVKA